MGKEKLKYTKEFLEKVKNGDTTATTLLYEDAKDIAYKKAYSILNNHHDAEDIAEDSVLRAIEKIDTIKRPGDFPAWIKRIAENKAKDYIKKKKPTYIGEDFEYTTNDLNSDQSVVPEKMVDSQENIDLYKKLISKLTDDQRNALVLNRIEGYKIREIAEMLDCSESTIKSRIHQGEKKLVKEAEKLKKKGYTLNGMMPLDFFTVMSKSLGVTSTNVASVVGATVLKSLSLKIVASIVAVVVVVSGVMGVSYIYGEQETTNSTTTKVVETTTQPPKPDYNEAYKAYKTVLKQNAFEIKDYDFQNETNKSKQIVFADILGDDTPELIFTKATIDSRDESRKNASLNIYSYANGKCEKISFEDDYSSDLKDEYILQTDDIQMYTPYIIYQKKNDKSLYMFQQKKSTAIVYKLYKFMPSTTDDTSLYLKTLMDQTYSTMPNVESSGTINGKEVGYDKCDKYKYNNLNKIDNLLLYSDKQDKEYGDYYSPEKCKAMTYSVAMKYLDKYDSNNVDCSGLEGSYIRVTNSYGDDTIEITEDGAFRSKDVWSQGEPCNESVGHGLITDLTKVNDYKYTFNCSDIVLDNEPGTYGKKYVNEKEVSVEYIDNLFNTDNKLVFYPKGTPVLCMDKADYKIYKATPASTSITEQGVLPQKTIILRGEKDNHVFIEWDIN